ncbi:hypothetical protein [Modestobacter roseus]|nr:hypothetical protein [Modestobacter roseus]
MPNNDTDQQRLDQNAPGGTDEARAEQQPLVRMLANPRRIRRA